MDRPLLLYSANLTQNAAWCSLHCAACVLLGADDGLQSIRRSGHCRGVPMPEGALCVFDRLVKLLFLLLVQALAGLLAAVEQTFQPVLYLGVGPGSGVLGGVLLGLPHCPVNLLPAHVAGALDGDLLPLPGVPVQGGDIDNAVGVNGKGDLNLGDAAERTADAVESELSQALVLTGHGPFALKHVDLHRGLEVGRCGKNLALGDGDGGVSLDETGADAAHGLNAQREGGDIQEQQAFYGACQNTALQACAHGDALIRIDALEGLFSDKRLDRLLDGGDTAGAAHHQHLADLGDGQAGIGESCPHRRHGLLHKVAGQLVELCAAEDKEEMLGAVPAGGDIGQVDLGGDGAGQFNLCLFRRLPDALHCADIL